MLPTSRHKQNKNAQPKAASTPQRNKREATLSQPNEISEDSLLRRSSDLSPPPAEAPPRRRVRPVREGTTPGPSPERGGLRIGPVSGRGVASLEGEIAALPRGKARGAPPPGSRRTSAGRTSQPPHTELSTSITKKTPPVVKDEPHNKTKPAAKVGKRTGTRATKVMEPTPDDSSRPRRPSRDKRATKTFANNEALVADVDEYDEDDSYQPSAASDISDPGFKGESPGEVVPADHRMESGGLLTLTSGDALSPGTGRSATSYVSTMSTISVGGTYRRTKRKVRPKRKVEVFGVDLSNEPDLTLAELNHGDLVWWRFGGRKMRMMTGRIVILEREMTDVGTSNEWLESITISLLGRGHNPNVVVVQCLDDMKYASTNASKGSLKRYPCLRSDIQEALMTHALRKGSNLNARGALRARMLSELKTTICPEDQPHNERHLLDVFVRAPSSSSAVSEDVRYLTRVDIFTLLREAPHYEPPQTPTPSDPPDSPGASISGKDTPTVPRYPTTTNLTNPFTIKGSEGEPPLAVRRGGSEVRGQVPHADRGATSIAEVDRPDGFNGRVRHARRYKSGSTKTQTDVKVACSGDNEWEHLSKGVHGMWSVGPCVNDVGVRSMTNEDLVMEVCVPRDELLRLLAIVPDTLLHNATRFEYPRHLPNRTTAVLACHSLFLSAHFVVSNYFLHALTSTVGVRLLNPEASIPVLTGPQVTLPKEYIVALSLDHFYGQSYRAKGMSCVSFKGLSPSYLFPHIEHTDTKQQAAQGDDPPRVTIGNSVGEGVTTMPPILPSEGGEKVEGIRVEGPVEVNGAPLSNQPPHHTGTVGSSVPVFGMGKGKSSTTLVTGDDQCEGDTPQIHSHVTETTIESEVDWCERDDYGAQFFISGRCGENLEFSELSERNDTKKDLHEMSEIQEGCSLSMKNIPRITTLGILASSDPFMGDLPSFISDPSLPYYNQNMEDPGIDFHAAELKAAPPSSSRGRRVRGSSLSRSEWSEGIPTDPPAGYQVTVEAHSGERADPSPPLLTSNKVIDGTITAQSPLSKPQIGRLTSLFFSAPPLISQPINVSDVGVTIGAYGEIIAESDEDEGIHKQQAELRRAMGGGSEGSSEDINGSQQDYEERLKKLLLDNSSIAEAIGTYPDRIKSRPPVGRGVNGADAARYRYRREGGTRGGGRRAQTLQRGVCVRERRSHRSPTKLGAVTSPTLAVNRVKRLRHSPLPHGPQITSPKIWTPRNASPYSMFASSFRVAPLPNWASTRAKSTTGVLIPPVGLGRAAPSFTSAPQISPWTSGFLDAPRCGVKLNEAHLQLRVCSLSPPLTLLRHLHNAASPTSPAITSTSVPKQLVVNVSEMITLWSSTPNRISSSKPVSSEIDVIDRFWPRSDLESRVIRLRVLRWVATKISHLTHQQALINEDLLATGDLQKAFKHTQNTIIAWGDLCRCLMKLE
eukprot:GHVN01003839.1.p1 GENE.GHVN01003839.1~~GHVN01003839.1.p1  ORF type:complete len:1436 (+),score=317.05 GHVN01003839.1:109-4416(+)